MPEAKMKEIADIAGKWNFHRIDKNHNRTESRRLEDNP